MLIVSDTTPISNLIQINRLSLLQELYDTVIIPQAVFDELKELERFGVSIQELTTCDWIHIETPLNNDLVERLLIDLDIGESEAIALAVEKNPDYLLIDEKQGRSKAHDYDLPVIGTLGSLIKAKHMGLIESIEVEMNSLRRIGFWISDELFEKVLELSGEL